MNKTNGGETTSRNLLEMSSRGQSLKKGPRLLLGEETLRGIRKEDFALDKIAGCDNPADMLTKHVSKDLMRKDMTALGLIYEDGRADSAPTLP